MCSEIDGDRIGSFVLVEHVQNKLRREQATSFSQGTHESGSEKE
jgi:hypothetical protein